MVKDAYAPRSIQCLPVAGGTSDPWFRHTSTEIVSTSLSAYRRSSDVDTIRPKGPNSSVVTWSVDGVTTIVEKILPHFDRYLLQSGKLQDFLAFREIVLRMRNKEHRDPLGFLELARLAFSRNATGKQRQYTLAMIESGILRGHTPDLLIQRKIWSDLHGDMQSVAEPK